MAPRQFQSTRPVWGATCFAIFGWILFEFQSTRPVWGATIPMICVGDETPVSIHAPRVGRDSGRRPLLTDKTVSIHAPRVGRDRHWRMLHGIMVRFNPRAPCGARRTGVWRSCGYPCFNPRAPCGARPRSPS